MDEEMNEEEKAGEGRRGETGERRWVGRRRRGEEDENEKERWIGWVRVVLIRPTSIIWYRS
jgi:hypothetical protein